MLILKMKFISTTHLGKPINKIRKDLITTNMNEKDKKKEASESLKNKDVNPSWLVNAVTGPPKKSPKTIWIVK